ncbi:ATP-binding protein [Brevibacillus parabrevis]|nr:ATP-binding protein [Brevibacillus parabrevis]MED2255040.1 ATP-binding protein [Brevibacillus parabrevis]
MMKRHSRTIPHYAAAPLWKYAIILTFFLALLLGLRWMWYSLNADPKHPDVEQGVLDMRGWDFERSPSISLKGQWEFYPNAFLSQKDLKQVPERERQYVQVPGDWSSAFPNAADSYGYGTYRLRILVDQQLEQPYTFWIQEIEAASRIEINGEHIGGLGVPATTAETTKPWKASYTATYTAGDAKVIELLIQSANFQRPHNGGIIKDIYFGSQAAVDTERWYSIGLQMATFLILLLHGLYAGILFVFKPRQKEFLFFLLLLFCVAIKTVIDYDNLMLLWFPIPYAWALKIELLSYIWQPLLMILLVRRLSNAGGETTSRLFRVYLFLLSLYSLFLLLASSEWVYLSSKLLSLYYLGPLLLFAFIIVRMLMRSQQDAMFLLIAAVSVYSNVIWGVLQQYQLIDMKNVYYPVDLIAALVSFSAYWFRGYFRHAEERAMLTEQLKKADKQKDQFLAHTSHELRTPLHGIMNIAETVVMSERHVMGSRSTQDMELLITISRRMSHLLDDLLDVVRLQDKHIVLDKKPLRIQAVTSGVISMLAYMAEGRPIQLQMEVPDSTPPILADEKRLVQILFNLIHNALKFTEQGAITVFAEAVGNQVEIRVSDTGIGMDEETQARIFKPYEQGGQRVNNGGGIGLGLAICAQLVELHDSKLHVHSEPGKGSHFSFLLPVVAEPESMASVENNRERERSGEKAYQVPVLTKSMRNEFHPSWSSLHTAARSFAERGANILAVDDDPVNLKVLERILSPYQITTCTSARDALDLLFAKQWDLIIMDVMMPHMSGYELTQKIREHFTLSELPILLLTARSQPEDIYTGYLAGANDYICKPVDGMELKYRVWSLTTLKQTVDERLRMEAAYLQAQIHPHFLFNTLSSILALSDIDTEKMRNLGDAFTSFLRISFDFLNTGERVPLSHELELVESYLYIEKERFGERLSIEWEVDPGCETVLIPPLTIQPLVENAVNHGLLSQIEGGTLRIRIVRQEDATRFEVQDDGVGMNKEIVERILDLATKEKGGIGVSNTHRRLTQMYGKGLSIQSKPGEGTTVSFVIRDQVK